MPQANEKVRVHAQVRGYVQNVGFRAFVEFNAHQIGIVGWVRNVGYDTVEAVAEGEREKVERFVEAMKTGPRSSRVDEVKVDWESPTGDFREFSVKRSL